MQLPLQNGTTWSFTGGPHGGWGAGSAWGALETNEQSPIFRYARRAYFVIDREGVVRYQKIMTNPLDLLDPDDVHKALKESGVS